MPNRKLLFLLAAITFTLYFNSLPNDFIFDDVSLIQSGVITNFRDLFASYRPLRHISYLLDYKIFGMVPYGFRLMNILYHILAVFSLFWLFKIFGLSQRASFVAALIFAIHPVNTDAVSYISGRRDLLMGLFYFLSVGFFFKFYNSVSPNNLSSNGTFLKKAKWRYLIFSLLSLSLSLSSKEMAATIPLIFILYAAYKEGSLLLKQRWFYLVSMIFLLLFSLFAFLAISGGGSALVSLNGVRFHGNSAEVHYLTATTIFLHYLKLSLFPLKLILDNAAYPLVSDWNFHVFLSIFTMFSLLFIVWRLVAVSNRRDKTPEIVSRDKSIAFWIVFFVVSLAPVLQIIPLHEIVALHYLYVPVVGFCAIVGILFDYFYERKSKILKNAAAACLILTIFLFSIRTFTRNFELKNIWTAIHVDESWGAISFRGYFTIGAEYLKMKFPDKAWEYYQKAVDTGAQDPILLANILNFYIVKGRHAEAFNFYNEMVQKHEYILYPGALNMAVLFMVYGKCDEALKIVGEYSPYPYQIPRTNLVKECKKHNFAQFDGMEIQDIYNKQAFMKELGMDVERKPFLKALIASNQFFGMELIDLINELAVIDLASDIPEAIKYYKQERELYLKMDLQPPEIIDKSIAALEDYQHKVIVEKRYLPLDF